MFYDGVILYGPPASGKDTITSALLEKYDRYELFQRLKSGTGNSVGYRMIPQLQLEALDAAGLIVYRNERYGNSYAVDRTELARLFALSRIPVLHMGQIAGVQSMESHRARWLSVLLWCPKSVTAERVRLRGNTDADARLAAWGETLEDVNGASPDIFAMALRTDHATPDEAAHAINDAVSRGRGSVGIADLSAVVGLS